MIQDIDPDLCEARCARRVDGLRCAFVVESDIEERVEILSKDVHVKQFSELPPDVTYDLTERYQIVSPRDYVVFAPPHLLRILQRRTGISAADVGAALWLVRVDGAMDVYGGEKPPWYDEKEWHPSSDFDPHDEPYEDPNDPNRRPDERRIRLSNPYDYRKCWYMPTIGVKGTINPTAKSRDEMHREVDRVFDWMRTLIRSLGGQQDYSVTVRIEIWIPRYALLPHRPMTGAEFVSDQIHTWVSGLSEKEIVADMLTTYLFDGVMAAVGWYCAVGTDDECDGAVVKCSDVDGGFATYESGTV